MVPPRPQTIVEITSSMFAIIDKQHNQSKQRLDLSANETEKWFKAAFEAFRSKQILEDEKQPAKKKPKVETSLPFETKQWVHALKVKELASILRDRGLDGNGVKKVLQQRLLESLEDQMILEQQQQQKQQQQHHHGQQKEKKDSPDSVVDSMMEDCVINDEPVPMDVDAKAESESKPEGQLKSSGSKVVFETTATEVKEHHKMGVTASPLPRRSPLKIVSSGVKSALKALSPVKQKSVNTLIQKIESAAKSRNDPAREELTVSSGSSRDDGSHSKISQGSTASFSSNRMMMGAARVVIAAGSNSESAATAGSTVKSQSMTAAQAARRAKLAEIRSKTKPVLTSTTSSVPFPSLSKVKSFAESSQTKNPDGKKHLLAQQMREKAFAKMHSSQSAQPGAMGPCKENSPNKAVQTANTSVPSAASLFKLKHAATGLKHQQTQKSSGGELKKPVNSAKKELTPASVKSMASTVLSPMDTYELSDREQSDDSDSEDEYSSSQKKRIPEWAQQKNLVPALEHQFTQKDHDPDTIFGEVQTCDLQQIFDKRKSRYQRRTSSGNWTQDRVTAAEKLAYKRTQGFATEA